jgi:hypothetical protein
MRANPAPVHRLISNDPPDPRCVAMVDLSVKDASMVTTQQRQLRCQAE